MATNESAMAIEESAGADGTNERVLVLDGLSDVLAQTCYHYALARRVGASVRR